MKLKLIHGDSVSKQVVFLQLEGHLLLRDFSYGTLVGFKNL